MEQLVKTNANTKWNWELAFVMYCGGMSFEDILSHKSFRGCPDRTLRNRATDSGWIKRRAEIAATKATDVLTDKAKALAENLKDTALDHQNFVLSQLKRERKVMENRPALEEGQMERLQILEKIDNIGRKTLKLDEQVAVNPNTQGFAYLVHLQTQSSQLEHGKTTPLAIMGLPANQNASEGILRSNNAQPDDVHEADFTNIEEPGDPEPPEGLKAMPKPGNLFGAAPIAPKS